MITYARKVGMHNGTSEFALLNELSRSVFEYIRKQKASGCNVGVFQYYDKREFIAIVTKVGLSPYMRRCLDDNPKLLDKVSKKPSLLEMTISTSATDAGLNRGFRRRYIFDVDMTRLLLARGAKPNVSSADGESTVWILFLEICNECTLYSRSTKEMFQMAELFIKYGADLHAKWHLGTAHREIRATPLVSTRAAGGRKILVAKYICIR